MKDVEFINIVKRNFVNIEQKNGIQPARSRRQLNAPGNLWKIYERSG